MIILIPPGNNACTVTQLWPARTQTAHFKTIAYTPRTSPPLQNNNIHTKDQSTIILQQFSMKTKELRNFMDKVSSDITKIMWACTTAQENTGKLIENVISQALTKP